MRQRFHIRSATPRDVNHFLTVENDAYPPLYLEEPEVFLTKVRVFPAGCKMIEDDQGVFGYLICHPWLENDIPPLNSLNFSLPQCPNVFFLHSLTLRRNHQKRGIGSLVCRFALSLGSELGYARFTLVSVQDSHDFWKRQGFSVVEPLPHNLRKKLLSYGNARFMIRTEPFKVNGDIR